MIVIKLLLDILFSVILWFTYAHLHAITPREQFRYFITRPLFRSIVLSNLAGGLAYLSNPILIKLWLHWIALGLISALLFHLFYKNLFFKREFLYIFIPAYTIVQYLVIEIIAGIKIYPYQHFSLIALTGYLLQSICILFVWKRTFYYFSPRFNENPHNRN